MISNAEDALFLFVIFSCSTSLLRHFLVKRIRDKRTARMVSIGMYMLVLASFVYMVMEYHIPEAVNSE